MLLTTNVKLKDQSRTSVSTSSRVLSNATARESVTTLSSTCVTTLSNATATTRDRETLPLLLVLLLLSGYSGALSGDSRDWLPGYCLSVSRE
jgi:hypothetical protein